jgi:hypothetical protein
MPATVWLQATAVTPTTTEGQQQATLRMTAISWLLTTAGRQTRAGMNATTGLTTQYGCHQKHRCLQKQWSRLQHGGRPTAAETIGKSQHQQQKGDPQQQGFQK